MYKDRGWQYFGGGLDLADSQKPAKFEVNGNKIAFIGCNPAGPDFAWARADGWPGAAPCGDNQWMIDSIKQLTADGYQVIATFQHFEYYSPEPRPQQKRDFEAMAQAGAVVVSGSQGHYAQAMEFDGRTFIHYGLGNLFFDQMNYIMSDGTITQDTRREFLDRHVFYNGHYINTELLTAQLEEFARPRPMTPEERAAFLQEYFTASDWLP
jgi:poly-gamma-glutamate synthesis protein (capsule biosynthesis protein)